MKKFLNSIQASAKELKNTTSLTVTAMLTALYVVLHAFTTIVVTAFIQIRFSSVALAMIGGLYGPVVGATAGAVGDILKNVVRPTGAFFPGFTFGEAARGFIYGLFLYKKTPSFWRVCLASFCSCLVVDLFLTTLWLTMMGVNGGIYIPLLIARLPKVAIMFPIETILVFSSLKLTTRIRTAKKA